MLFDGTSENIALGAAVRSRVNADARMVNARAALWRLGGYGLLALGVGAGLGIAAGLGALGYSYVADVRSSAETIAEALAAALAKTTIKADGTVKMADGSQVGLKPGGVVSLQPGATVKMDPASAIGIRADQFQQLLGGAGGRDKTSKGEVIKREVTVFSTVSHGRGEVMTGWRYPNGGGGTPTYQYCYYNESNGKHTSSRIDIAYNGSRLADINTAAVPDLEDALQKCQWTS